MTPDRQSMFIRLIEEGTGRVETPLSLRRNRLLGFESRVRLMEHDASPAWEPDEMARREAT